MKPKAKSISFVSPSFSLPWVKILRSPWSKNVFIDSICEIQLMIESRHIEYKWKPLDMYKGTRCTVCSSVIQLLLYVVFSDSFSFIYSKGSYKYVMRGSTSFPNLFMAGDWIITRHGSWSQVETTLELLFQTFQISSHRHMHLHFFPLLSGESVCHGTWSSE